MTAAMRTLPLRRWRATTMPRWFMGAPTELVCWKYLAETHNADNVGAVAMWQSGSATVAQLHHPRPLSAGAKGGLVGGEYLTIEGWVEAERNCAATKS